MPCKIKTALLFAVLARVLFAGVVPTQPQVDAPSSGPTQADSASADGSLDRLLNLSFKDWISGDDIEIIGADSDSGFDSYSPVDITGDVPQSSVGGANPGVSGGILGSDYDPNSFNLVRHGYAEEIAAGEDDVESVGESPSVDELDDETAGPSSTKLLSLRLPGYEKRPVRQVYPPDAESDIGDWEWSDEETESDWDWSEDNMDLTFKRHLGNALCQ